MQLLTSLNPRRVSAAAPDSTLRFSPDDAACFSIQ
jgi:hypothetical protein